MNNQNPASALELRVNQLEMQGRRMKLLLIGLPVVALLLGAEASEQTTSTKTLEAENLVLKDKEGRVRVHLRAEDNQGNPVLLLADEKGGALALLHKHKRAGALVLYSDGGKELVTVGEANASNGYGTINFYDDKGNWKQSLGGGSLE